MNEIKEPMDFTTIMNKFKAEEYEDKFQFFRDIRLVFSNCREFNEQGTEIYNSANKLENFFRKLWSEYGLDV